VFAQVSIDLFEYFHAISRRTNQHVATKAQNPARIPRHMIVIDVNQLRRQITQSATTNSARLTLLTTHPPILGRLHPIRPSTV
jgi:hypothetical protein